MTQTAPPQINPKLFAEQQAHFHGTIALTQLPRLADVLTDQQGDLTYDIQFQQNDDQPVLITLTWEAQVHLLCQRCLNSFQCSLQRTTRLQPMTDDMPLSLLAEDIEPVMLEPETHCFHLLDLLTDELILQIPVFAKHPVAECAVRLETETSAEQVRQKPFAQLAELLDKKNK